MTQFSTGVGHASYDAATAGIRLARHGARHPGLPRTAPSCVGEL